MGRTNKAEFVTYSMVITPATAETPAETATSRSRSSVEEVLVTGSSGAVNSAVWRAISSGQMSRRLTTSLLLSKESWSLKSSKPPLSPSTRA
ncbi:hypothetical protein GN244_ATG03460 [Phytophthora infestans]|uniref:Uncharacterized protein n=1 Tax=Phytophthora infestans TaxID=4787 RepID=A0A833X059_PHYIN|nr:hypothetical protein GN244_ATG03460 [Phytophthora infestans]